MSGGGGRIFFPELDVFRKVVLAVATGDELTVLLDDAKGHTSRRFLDLLQPFADVDLWNCARQGGLLDLITKRETTTTKDTTHAQTSPQLHKTQIKMTMFNERRLRPPS